MKWLPSRLNPPAAAAALASVLLLIAMIAIPFTRSGLLESISVKLGYWHYWIPGYTDGHNWVPNERLPEAAGPNAVLISAVLEESGKSGGKYLLSNPNDPQLRALYIRRTLRDKSMSLVNSEDYPYGQSDPEEERKQAQRLAKLQAQIPSVLAAAIEGERQEPDNAFFPIAQAIAYESLRDRTASRKALERAVDCANYNDYWYTTWITFKSATAQHIYDRLSDAMHAEPEIMRELLHFAKRLSHERDSEALIMKGLLFDCLTRIGSQSSTTSEFVSVKWAMRAFIPSKSLYPTTLGRRSNAGDVFRKLTQLQINLINAGYIPRADLPAFYGTEIYSSNWHFDGDPAEWEERSYRALLSYEGAVITGMFVIECLLGLLVFAPVLWVLSKIKLANWPHFGIPPLIAFVTTIATIVNDSRLVGSISFVGTCFLIAFTVSFIEKSPRYSIAAGVVAMLGSAAIGIVFYDEFSGSEFIPGIVYAVGMLRTLWIRNRDHVRGWIFSLAGVMIIAIAAASMWPITLFERALTFLPAAALTLLSVCVWYRSHIGEAAKRLLRVAPVAFLAGVILMLGITVWHHLLVNEMNWLIGIEADMAASGREAPSEIGPPLRDEYKRE